MIRPVAPVSPPTGRRAASAGVQLARRALLAAGLSAAALGLSACAGGPDLADYAASGPALAPERYFDGRLEGWGVFQDRFDDVRRRFKVDIVGRWDGETLTLDEDFVYEDGSTEKRVWRLTKTGPDTWRGEAAGVVGEATGRVAGNALNFRYTFDLVRPNGDTLRVDFDDWLWLQDDRVLVNRAYVSKFGIEIGTLSIFFRRETPMP
ncbi:MAG: DUF3833 domain-containing protein [Pseudomonadota bacterium]